MPKSYQQVLSQIEKLQEQAKSLRAKEISGVVARIKEAIEHYGLTAEDLFATSGARSARNASPVKKGRRGGVPKYQSADGHTWSGVGKRPGWFVEALNAGKSAKELLVGQASPGRTPAKRRKGVTKPSKAAGVAKYHDGNGLTWTGRGKRPAWFISALDSGKSAEDLLIQQG